MMNRFECYFADVTVNFNYKVIRLIFNQNACQYYIFACPMFMFPYNPSMNPERVGLIATELFLLDKSSLTYLVRRVRKHA